MGSWVRQSVAEVPRELFEAVEVELLPDTVAENADRFGDGAPKGPGE